MHELFERFLSDLNHTTVLEYVAVFAGIASVWFSRKENILVYPVGLVNTSIFIYLYLKHGLYADASVNFYYTVMSILGWSMWAKKNMGESTLKITSSNAKEWGQAVAFFGFFFVTLFLVLKNFTDSTVPIADSFTSAAAFTGMWLMNKKKLENWIWWIITDIAAIPLNFHKHLVFTSFQYLVFLILATMGYFAWKKKLQMKNG